MERELGGRESLGREVCEIDLWEREVCERDLGEREVWGISLGERERCVGEECWREE